MKNYTAINTKQLRFSVTGIVAALVFGLAGQSTAWAAEYERIVAFGDSLMDSGNAFVLTGEVSTPPFDPVPSGAYAIGGHHFSNGRTWVEQLGEAMGLQRS